MLLATARARRTISRWIWGTMDMSTDETVQGMAVMSMSGMYTPDYVWPRGHVRYITHMAHMTHGPSCTWHMAHHTHRALEAHEHNKGPMCVDAGGYNLTLLVAVSASMLPPALPFLTAVISVRSTMCITISINLFTTRQHMHDSLHRLIRTCCHGSCIPEMRIIMLILRQKRSCICHTLQL